MSQPTRATGATMPSRNESSAETPGWLLGAHSGSSTECLLRAVPPKLRNAVSRRLKQRSHVRLHKRKARSQDREVAEAVCLRIGKLLCGSRLAPTVVVPATLAIGSAALAVRIAALAALAVAILAASAALISLALAP